MISKPTINTILDDGDIPTKNDRISVVAYHRPLNVVSFESFDIAISFFFFVFDKNDISMKHFITILTEFSANAF